MGQVEVEPGSFLTINREERFFCSLLTHGLLSSPTMRQRFYRRVLEETGIELGSGPGETEVYSEVAWLRDHWRNLGDPRKWTAQLQQDRIDFVARCLAPLSRDVSDVEGERFLWTSGKAPKVVSPGRWPLAALGDDKQLKLLKWAFNSKPDFLLVSGASAVIIEAKVESGPGKGSSGFAQDEVQQVLQALIPAVAPYLEPRKTGRLWLAPEPVPSTARTVQWADVAEIVATVPRAELDDFSRQGLERFARRAQEEEEAEDLPPDS